MTTIKQTNPMPGYSYYRQRRSLFLVVSLIVHVTSVECY